jgi:xylose isomerase
MHLHANSQGADGVRIGGQGKHDIDYGLAITAANLGNVKMLKDAGYDGWIGHDMQVRPYDNPQRGVERILESVANWEGMARVVAEVDWANLDRLYADRDTRRVQAYLQDAISQATKYSREIFPL